MDLSSFLQHRVFKVLSKVAAQQEVETYVVGGYVRDLLLYGEDAAPKDIDVVVVGSGILMAEKVREAIRGEVHLAVYKNGLNRFFTVSWLLPPMATRVCLVF